MGGAAGLIWGGLACNCRTALSEKQKHAHRHGRELAEKKKKGRKLAEDFGFGGVLPESGAPRTLAGSQEVEEAAGGGGDGSFQMDGKVDG